METGALTNMILNTMSEQVYVRDIDKNLLFINRAAAELTGWSESEAMGKKCYQVFGDPGEKCRSNCPVDKAIQEQKPLQHQTGKLITRSGQTRMMRVSVTPTAGTADGEAAAVVMMQDITQEKRLEKLLLVQRDLGIRLSQTNQLDKALDLSLEAILHLNEVDSVGIYLIDQKDGSIHLAVHENLPEWFVEQASYYGCDTPQAKKAKTKGPYFTDYNSLMLSLKLDEEEIQQRTEAGFKAFAMIPIRHNQNPIAALNIASLHVESFQEFTQHALEAIATQIAGTLSKIISYKELENSQRNFSILFNNLEDLLFVVDFDGNIISCNQKACEKLGYSLAHFRTMHILDLAPDDERELAATTLAAMFEGRENRCDIAMQSIEGEVIPIETITAMGTWNNRKALYGLCRDISDRVAAREALRLSEERARADLKEKEVLLREIHHRVKNNMQVISSLLYLQAFKSPDSNIRKALEEAENRVHSMALVHEILYQSKTITNINFQTYLEQLTEHVRNTFLDTTLVDIEVDTGSLEMKMEQSISCGLIITELLTNSLKHAFKNMESGKICIEAKPLAPPVYELKFCDNGCGIPADRIDSGTSMLGLKLVRELVQDQLEGTLSLEQETGACWKITWPVQLK